MKILKLYGEKPGPFDGLLGGLFNGLFEKKGFIAEIFVKNGEVFVESGDKNLEKELIEMIDERVQENLFTIGRCINEKLSDGRKIRYHIDEVKKPEDPRFLNAIRDSSALWNTQTFASYRISGILSRFTEE